MDKYPEPLENLIKEFQKLPSIGRKTAERLAFYLLHQPPEELDLLSQAITNVKEKIRACKICFNYTEIEHELCEICRDPKRDASVVCVVSHPQELLKLEKTREYRGLYHVLGGLISPVNGVGPEQLHIEELLVRLRTGNVQEVILALDPKVEGEATAMYLARKIKPLGVKITQIAHGVPVGRDLEFADEVTLSRALAGRVQL
ncbi:MAG: recombination mediator RecR [Candidatus Bipolaricaulota bacterium]|nr:recombination mediator RecR [Candidatus Bipolaricaulota bacterium]MCS7275388.1 recombination mediator RecR [Candidatus Bipolaricaulota bacterium]MDW8110113.1 recombination mediator RecR [Candidatus Bipolaricaulota bacterium]MDW8328967.1 recombination mediator RecR [Candidatus Bipolaricaulota bacterium]